MSNTTPKDVAIVKLTATTKDDVELPYQLPRPFFICALGNRPQIVRPHFVDCQSAEQAINLASQDFSLVSNPRAESLWPGGLGSPTSEITTLIQVAVLRFGFMVYKLLAYGANNEPLINQPESPYWLCSADGTRVISVHSSALAAWTAGKEYVAELEKLDPAVIQRLQQSRPGGL